MVQLAELMTGSPLPAPFTAVLAAVAARTRREGSLAPECRMLRSVIPEGQMVTWKQMKLGLGEVCVFFFPCLFSSLCV